MSFKLKYKRFGSYAILIEWAEEISTYILDDIIGFKFIIETEYKHDIQELVNGYNSLTVVYSVKIENFSKSINQLKSIYLKKNVSIKAKPKFWRIPVCYDEEFGLDLHSLSVEKRLSNKDIIKLHTKPVYKVYFIGFLPGFLYLGGLDSKLKINRKANPRLKVPEGSVAIGGEQTGVYPSESAGGWHIIGKTPISFFDISKKKPCFANSGDHIQFVSITKNELCVLEKDIENGMNQLKLISND